LLEISCPWSAWMKLARQKPMPATCVIHANRTSPHAQVLPEAFLVTKPHGRTTTWRAAAGTARDEAQLARVRQLYERFKDELVSYLAA
jgi:hypothetical protein